jgi:preprotein translocase subunit SecG
MNTIAFIGQIAVSIILSGLILLQTSPENNQRSVSLIRPKFNRRGLEKLTFIATFVFAFIFIVLSLWQIFI